jgi:hypothetical protein
MSHFLLLKAARSDYPLLRAWGGGGGRRDCNICDGPRERLLNVLPSKRLFPLLTRHDFSGAPEPRPQLPLKVGAEGVQFPI